MTATDPIHRPVGRSAVWLPRDVVRRSTSGAVVFGAGVRDLLGQLATGAALRRAARPFSAVGAIFGLALPAFLVTAATNGRAGVRDLLRRTLRWRVGVGWYLLAILAIPVGALLLAPLFLGAAPLERLPENWTLLLTEFLPQLLLALVTVQFFEELGWAGFVQHRLQPRRGALKASLLVALAFAYLHLPTYLNAPVSAESALRDLSVMVIVMPFAICFRILITFAYNRTGFSVLIAAITHTSFNEASENHRTERARTTGPGSRVRLSRTVGTSRRGDQQRHAGLQPRSQSGCAPGCLKATPARRSTRAPYGPRPLPRRAGSRTCGRPCTALAADRRDRSVWPHTPTHERGAPTRETENNQTGTLDDHLRLGAGCAAADRPRTSGLCPHWRRSCLDGNHDQVDLEVSLKDIEGRSAAS